MKKDIKKITELRDPEGSVRGKYRPAFDKGVRVTKHTDHGDEVYLVTRIGERKYNWKRIDASP